MSDSVGAVVMASGESTRFGSNKLIAEFFGQPLILHVLQTIKKAGCTPAVTVTRYKTVETICGRLSFPCLLHSDPFLSDTIRLGLSALLNTHPDLKGCLFFQSDQPLLTTGSIQLLLRTFERYPQDICRLSFNGEPGSPVLFPAEFFSELLHLPEDHGGGAVLKRHPDRVRLIPAQSAEELMDADTPEALSGLRRYLP